MGSGVGKGYGRGHKGKDERIAYTKTGGKRGLSHYFGVRRAVQRRLHGFSLGLGICLRSGTLERDFRMDWEQRCAYIHMTRQTATFMAEKRMKESSFAISNLR